MWNQRYEGEEYAYGTEPNLFFRELIQSLPPGKLLLPAEGEGRNAVFAARLGWSVTAVDFAGQGARKAALLAERHHVKIDYFVADIADFEFPRNTYDVAGLIYAHLPPDIRPRVHEKIIESLKPGGYIILEAFHKDQFRNSTGGPKKEDLLYTTEILERDFSGIEFIRLEKIKLFLSQGSFHQGESDVVRLFGRKRSE